MVSTKMLCNLFHHHIARGDRVEFHTIISTSSILDFEETYDIDFLSEAFRMQHPKAGELAETDRDYSKFITEARRLSWRSQPMPAMVETAIDVAQCDF